MPQSISSHLAAGRIRGFNIYNPSFQHRVPRSLVGVFRRLGWFFFARVIGAFRVTIWHHAGLERVLVAR